MSKLTLYANPYDTSYTGFYFHDFDEFEDKEEKHEVEEFEIDFIKGDEIEQKLFEAMGVNQANLEDYFDTLDDLEDDDILKLSILMDDLGYDFDDAMDKKEDLIVYGEYEDDKDFAYNFVDERGGLEQLDRETLETYFDWDSYARDLAQHGTINEKDGVYYDSQI